MLMSARSERATLEIVDREDFSDVTYSLVVHHPLMAKAARPGQFVIRPARRCCPQWRADRARGASDPRLDQKNAQ
jgi:hypothetical protein